MKRLIKLSLIFLSCIIIVSFSSGQEKFGTELVKMMVIQGIGIDKIENGYKVTIQMINNTQNSFINGQGSPENVSKQYMSVGSTIAEALEHAEKLSGKKPMYAHNRIIVIGEKTAQENVGLILDFFTREYNTKPTVKLVVAQGCTAEEIINAQIGADNLISQRIDNILEESAKVGETNLMRIFEAVNYIEDKTEALCIPAIRLQTEEQSQGVERTSNQKMISLSGIAVFNQKSELLGYLEGEATLGFTILNDSLQEGVFQINLGDDESAVLKIEGLRTKTKVRYENGRVYIEAKATLHCDLIEITNKNNFTQVDRELANLITMSAEKKVCEMEKKAITAAQQEFGVDMFRFGRRLWLFDNKTFETIPGNWHNAFREAQITVIPKVILRRTGEGTLFQ